MKQLPYLFLLPAFLAFLLCLGWPIFMVGQLSLQQTNFITTRFVGLENFKTALMDRAFLQSIINCLQYATIIVPIQVVGSLLIAFMVLDVPKAVRDMARFVFYVPSLSAGIIISRTWRWMFASEGIINYALGVVGISPVEWLLNRGTGLFAVSVAIVFATIGVQMLIVLGSMMAIPKDITEAALIDGCSRGQLRSRIILPMVMPTLGITTLMGLLGAMQMWETARFITAGSPMGGTATMGMDIVATGFEAGKHGLASAKGIVMMAIVAALSLVKRRMEKA